jgi:hypothetical protein
MNNPADTPAAAETEVELARAALAATLDQLKDNLQPKHLLVEVMAPPRARVAQWLTTYGSFAKQSPIAGVIMGTAALALTSSLLRRKPRRSKITR